MAYKRKYHKGGLIRSVDELLKQEFVYCNHQILNRGWFGSWQLSYAKRMVDRGAISYAVKNEVQSRTKLTIDICGRQMPLKKVALLTGIPYATLYKRVKRGVPRDCLFDKDLRKVKGGDTE